MLAYVFVFKTAKDFNLSQCSLAVCLVLKWANLLDRNTYTGHIIYSRAAETNTNDVNNNQAKQITRNGQFVPDANVDGRLLTRPCHTLLLLCSLSSCIGALRQTLVHVQSPALNDCLSFLSSPSLKLPLIFLNIRPRLTRPGERTRPALSYGTVSTWPPSVFCCFFRPSFLPYYHFSFLPSFFPPSLPLPQSLPFPPSLSLNPSLPPSLPLPQSLPFPPSLSLNPSPSLPPSIPPSLSLPLPPSPSLPPSILSSPPLSLCLCLCLYKISLVSMNVDKLQVFFIINFLNLVLS